MAELLNLTGLVLSAMPVGDYDKRVVVLTKERGKITAFARNARRQNSGLLAAANPFCFGTFSFYEGRSAYTMVQGEVQNYFRDLASSVGAYYGFYFLELADYYARENNDEKELLKLLYVSLRALTKEELDKELIQRIYEWKTIVLSGEYPQMFACTECGSESDLSAFVLKRNGIFCQKCSIHYSSRIPLMESTIYALQYVLSSPVEKLYSFALSEEVRTQFFDVVEHLKNKYIGKQFKSLEILESIRNY